jgi:hypothetical protein
LRCGGFQEEKEAAMVGSAVVDKVAEETTEENTENPWRWNGTLQ